MCGNENRNAPTPFYYPINASVQQEQWQQHVTRLDDLDSSSSYGPGRAVNGRSESSSSGIGEAQLLEETSAFTASHYGAPGSAEPETQADSTHPGWRSCAVGCAVTMAFMFAAFAGYATLARAGTSASQLHLPQVPFLGEGTPKEPLLSGKEERKPHATSGCCRGPQARCRACEASLPVAVYCRRQQRPVHVAGCEEFKGVSASVHSSEESEKEEADAKKAPKPQLPTSGPMLTGGGSGTRCCTEETAHCVACNVGMSVLEYCSRTDALKVSGCDDVRHTTEWHSSTISHSSTTTDEEQRGIVEQRKAAMIAKLKAQFAEKKREEERHERQREKQLAQKEAEELQRLENHFDHMGTSAKMPTHGSTETSTSTATLTTKPSTTVTSSSSSSSSISSTKTTPTVKVKVILDAPSSTQATRSTKGPVPQATLQPTLFCFSLMLPWGYEPGLLRMQLQRGQSIFACDATEVYSSKQIDLGGLITVDLGIDLHCPLGGVFHTVMNTPIFLEVWKRIIEAGRFRQYQWTVKADPDAVFFPKRLRHILKGDQAKAAVDKGIFLNNCGFGLHGPLEVVSNRALEAYGEGSSTCKRPPQEDVYLQRCLNQLGVTQVNHFNLLAEDHCAFKDWEECSSGHVAFHPFKKVEDYERCLDAVEGDPAVS